jgi:hypothetical protein
MDSVAVVLAGLIAFFFLFTVFAFHFQRFLWKRQRRLGKKELGFCPTFSSLGGALQKANLFLQPQAKMVTMVEDADASEDEDAPAKDGPEHLARQLKPIRNGEEIGGLTVLLRLWR